MVDIRKIIIIFVIGILFSVLVFSVIDAIYPQPEYNDFCGMEKYRGDIVKIPGEKCTNVEPSTNQRTDCDKKAGYIEYTYDSSGCSIDWECNTCHTKYENAREDYYKVVFYVSAILALVAIFIGMYLPAGKNELNEWIGTGFMLGGTFALFFGTMQSFSYLDRIVRPIVIFFELVLVIFVAYKKIGNLREDKPVITKKNKKK